MTNQTKTIIGIALLILFTVLSITFVIWNNESKKDEQAIRNGITLSFYSDETETVEYGDDVNVMSFVKEYKGDLKKPTFSTKEVGTHLLEYTISSGDYEATFTKIVEVVDTQKPTIQSKDEEAHYIVNKGENFHLSGSDFEAKDPVDGKLDVQIEGTVKTDEVGTFQLKAVALDKNKNRTEKTITVEVVDPNQNKVLDYSLGEELDAYERINSSTVLVRDRTISIPENITDEQLLQVVKQINLCPSYLLEQVDTIQVVDRATMDQLHPSKKEGASIYGYHEYQEKQSVVTLCNDVTDDQYDAFIHEASHAYSIKKGIVKDKEFKKIYQQEGKIDDGFTNENINEFFAYHYTTYLFEGKDGLSSYPKLVKYFEEMKI